VQEEILFEWLKPQAPMALFMDSMAELGDQLFVHRRQRWGFLSAYTDLDHSEKFQRLFYSEGLLRIKDIYQYFAKYFLKVREKFGSIPIFYLHFPSTLESREKYRIRHDAILEAVDRIAVEFPPFYSLSVNDSVVDWPEEATKDMRNFAYHYNSKTYETFAEMVRATGVF
jgi:hypothetical protein